MSDPNPFANWPHIEPPHRQADPEQDRGQSRRLLEDQRRTERDDDMARSNNGFEDFLGGSPASVLAKLFFVSIVVGALLMWLDIRPMDILRGIQDFFHRIAALGFGAVHELLNYLLAGAAIVVPAWLVLRLMNMGSRR
jgi:hypothetical protein